MEDDTIKIKEYMTSEQALEVLKAQKKDSASIGHLFYSLLAQAPPEVVGHMEEKASSLIAAGHNIGKSFSQANDDEDKKQIFMTELQKIAIKLRKEAEEMKKNEEPVE